MSWFGFWIFLAVFWAVEGTLFYKGYDTGLYTHKTPAEKEIQRIKIDAIKAMEASK